MVSLTRILCPVDLSEFSQRALQYAVALGRWYGAEVTALHVRPRSPRPLVWGEDAIVPSLETILEGPDADAAVQRFVADTVGNVPAVFVAFRDGPVVSEVVRYAADSPTDLIVMGTHGSGGFERLVLGSVTEKVLRKAPCPVLTVPRAAIDGPHVTFKTIVCGVDFSNASIHALDYALSLAQEAEGRLVLAHAIENLDLLQEPSMYARFDVAEYMRVVEAGALERLAALIPDTARAWCQPELAIGHGKAYRELVRIARERHAELIVLGTHGRGALDAAIFGSTTGHVVRHAPCPVLTVRAQRKVASAVA